MRRQVSFPLRKNEAIKTERTLNFVTRALYRRRAHTSVSETLRKNLRFWLWHVTDFMRLELTIALCNTILSCMLRSCIRFFHRCLSRKNAFQ